MPAFYIHTPNRYSRSNASTAYLPSGVISESHNFSYGYCQQKMSYYINTGWLNHRLLNIDLSFDEAKCFFDALCFLELRDIETKKATSIIKNARKKYFSGYNEMFWHFITEIEAANY